jgi:Flp pilus assembly protein TadD
VYALQGRLGDAEQSWKEVTRLNPFHARAHSALGKIYFASGRLTEAEKEFQAGLLTDPHNAEALAALREIAAKLTRQP